MPIVPLQQFEADLAEYELGRRIDALVEKGFSRDELEGLSPSDLAAFERKAPPRTLVVRFGVMKLVGEYPCKLDNTPGCGSKVVVRTHRGVELGEMLTSTCPNSGCSKSVSRKEMLDFIENSGGRQYPFFDRGRVLRVATPGDLDAQARIEQSRHGLRAEARDIVNRIGLPIKIVDVEPILGGERLTYYYASDDRVDHNVLVRELGRGRRERIDLRHVGARDEARITADYEKCGQYCCCKNFLKVLKPVSMKSAKVQKATLDPVKISGRCGRLMCCLRYEDETYDELRKRLPRKKTRVGTPDGDGIIVDTQILTQLALVELDDGKRVAVPIEELAEPGMAKPRPQAERQSDGRADSRSGARSEGRPPRGSTKPPPRRPRDEAAPSDETAAPTKKKRRRRRRKSDGAPDAQAPETQPSIDDAPTEPKRHDSAPSADDEGGPTKKKRRRRRRKRKPDEGGEGGGPSPENGTGGGGSGDGPDSGD